MSSLKQFQEEGDRSFDKQFPALFDSDQSGLGYDVAPEVKSFLSQQTTLAYELGKKEMLEMVVKEIEGMKLEIPEFGKRDDMLIDVSRNKTLDSLKQKLLALNEE